MTGLNEIMYELERLVLECEQRGITDTCVGAVANIRGHLVGDPRSKFYRAGQDKLLSHEHLIFAAYGLRVSIDKHIELKEKEDSNADLQLQEGHDQLPPRRSY